MLTTIYPHDIDAIINSCHRSPHHILGMHIVELLFKGKRISVPTVRAFLPEAQKAYIIDAEHPTQKWEMERVHDNGLFEGIIWEKKEKFKYKLEYETFYGHTIEMDDPYGEWVEHISDFDRFLFNSSTHYKMYEKLGAHILDKNGVKGTHFSVWAPSAKRVSVIGDFNGWDGRKNQMEFLENAGVWVHFIPNLDEGTIYKYEIKTQSGKLLEKADPYANHAELRPKTASIVNDLNDFKWTDKRWIDRRAKNDFLNQPISIYEIHLGSWRRNPEEDNRMLTYRELADELLDYIIEMGFTHIQLMPIEEHPFDGSWGYQVTGYFAPTSRFGKPKDLQYFINKCHSKNIGVLLDWVPAHFPKDAHGLMEFDGTALYEHGDPRQGEHKDWGTKIFNFGRPEVKNFLISNALYWIDKFHMDGLRVDAVASMLYLDYSKGPGEWIPNEFGGRENLEAIEFMKHLNSVVYEYFPGSLMMAEESTSWPNVSRPAYMGGLGFGFKWNMGWMNDVLNYMQKDPIHRKYHHGQLTFGLLYAWTENFILPFSHDEVTHGKGSMINKMPGDYWQKFANLRVLYTFMWGHPGKQLLFMGQEFAQFAEWNEDKSLDWNLLDFDFHKGMQDCVKELNNIYKSEKSLWERDFTSDGFEGINCDDSENSTITFIRRSNDPFDFLIFAINFTPVPLKNYRIGVPELCSYKEIFNSDAGKYCGSNTGNKGKLKAKKEDYFGYNNSIELFIPPLAGIILKPVYPAKKKAIKKPVKKAIKKK